MRVFISVLVTLAGVVFLSAVLVYSGAISFAADEPHSAAVFELIESAREHSIEARSDGIEARDVDDAELARGAEHYGAMCETCHLAPGIDDTELRRGLYPQPPNLSSREYARARAAGKAAAARQFWIVKHGLKASAMPAWGMTHDDDAIWAIVAFLQKLPELSPDQYQALTASGNAHNEQDHEAERGARAHEEDSQAPDSRAKSGAQGPQMDASTAHGDSPESVVEAFNAALSTGRAQDAQSWLAPDVLVYESGGKESSREEYAAHHLRADMDFLAQARVQRLERTAHDAGDTAWVTSRSRMRGEVDGKPLDLISTETIVLTREPQGWRIRHIHWSSAPGDEHPG